MEGGATYYTIHSGVEGGALGQEHPSAFMPIVRICKVEIDLHEFPHISPKGETRVTFREKETN